MDKQQFIQEVLKRLLARGINAGFEEEYDPEGEPLAVISMRSPPDTQEITASDPRIVAAREVFAELGFPTDEPGPGGYGGYHCVATRAHGMYIEVAWMDPSAGVGISFCND